MNRSRLLICALLSLVTYTASAQTASVSFVGDVQVDATGFVTSLQVQGTLGDNIYVSYGAAGAVTTCGNGSFQGLTILKLTPNGDSFHLTSALQTVSLTAVYSGALGAPANPLTAGKVLCLRADRGGVVRSVYSDTPKTILAAPTLTSLKVSSQPIYGDLSLNVLPSIPTPYLPIDLFVFNIPVPLPGVASLDCNPAGMAAAKQLKLGTDAEASQEIVDNSPIALNLNQPLTAGDQVCVVGVYRKAFVAAGGIPAVNAGDRVFAPIVRVTSPPTGQISFLSDLVGGLSTVTFTSTTAGSVSIYLFGAGYTGALGNQTCSLPDREHGALLTAVGNGTNATVSSIAVLANTPEVVSLSQPLTAGSRICLFESTSSSSEPTIVSDFKPVNYFAPGEDYGRFSLGFVGGAVISNQEQSSNSSTASQYLEAAFNYTIMRGVFRVDGNCPVYRKHCGLRGGPGLQAFMDIRSATIPVTSIDNQSQAHQDQTVDITQSLNALSSQQSVRIVTGLYAPFRLTRWYRSTNWLTLAPLAVGGFDTLLNPTAPQAAPSTASILNTTTANFSSVYGYFAVGGEINWKVYSASTDEAPRDMGWFSATLGHYSNLPSYVCSAYAKPASESKAFYFKDVANPATNCFVDTITTTDPQSSVVSTSYNVYASRKLIPRLDIAGQLALPTLPVVLGLDANLGQYLIGANKHEHIDTLNKAGNDVRIFIGIKLDVTHLLNKIGVSTGH